MKVNVNYIRWGRDDAVGKVSDNILSHINKKQNINTVVLEAKSSNVYKRVLRIIKSTFKIAYLLFKKEVVHFEESKRFETNINILIRNKRSVLTVHHIDYDKNYLNSLFLKLKYRSFSKIIAVSENTKKDIINKYRISSSKIITAYNGVNKSIFRPLNKKSFDLVGKKYILYLGSEVPRKNIYNLLKAFKEILLKHPNLFLVKAGYSGGDKYRENTKKIIQDLGLRDRVILISKRLNEKDLPLYYSNSELFIYPTLQEGFGMPLVEAMACGCPIVTSNINPMKEIARGQVLVNPFKYKDIAKGIDKVLSSEKYKKELKEKAITRSNDFDWEESANKILNIYKELKSI